ncbi:MAG TPA: hypothetical protein VIH02_09020, partial [Flavobacterium sp.]
MPILTGAIKIILTITITNSIRKQQFRESGVVAVDVIIEMNRSFATNPSGKITNINGDFGLEFIGSFHTAV